MSIFSRPHQTIIPVIIVICSGLFTIQASNADQLTLEECVGIARQNNLEIRSAQNNYLVSKEDVWKAYGGLMPRLDSWVSGSRTVTGPTGYQRWDQNTNQFVNASTGISISKNYSAGFSLSQTLFDGGANIYNVYNAEAQRNASRYQYVKAEKDIIFSVKEKYYSLLKAKMLLAVRIEAVKRGEEKLKIAQSRYDLGATAISDVLKAKVQYGTDKLDLVDAENVFKMAMADLNYILNRDVNLDIEPVQEFRTPETGYDYESALKTAMQRQPALLEAQENLRASNYQKLAARGSWLPSLSLRASYGWNDHKLNLSNFTDENYQWNVSGTLSFNIFEGFQTKATHNSYKIAYRTARDNLYAAQNGVALEVKQAFLNLGKAREQLQVTEESEKAAQEDFNLAQEKYNLGAATILDVIVAQVNYKQAEANRIQSLFDYNLAISQLEKAIGL